MNNFIYENKTKVYFGKGCVKEYLTCILKHYSDSVMLAYGGGSIKRNGVYNEIMTYLEKAGKFVTEFSGIMPNPTYAKVQEGAELAREKDVGLILAVGGGSVIDCCKIISAQAKTERDIWNMEFNDKTYPDRFIPMIAVVTVSGTGAEMNSGAVVTNTAKKLKSALFGAQADIAMLDPSYTMSVPMPQVMSGAFDTLCHCMETYFDKVNENNLSDDINEAVMRSVIRNMRILKTEPLSYTARSELMWASAMAENGILKIGKLTGFQAHMIEHQLGAYTDCNHGFGLAAIYPAYLKRICESNIDRFVRFAENVWNVPKRKREETALAGINALADFIKDMGLPLALAEIGITDKDVLRKAADSTVLLEGIGKKLTHDDVYEILLQALLRK